MHAIEIYSIFYQPALIDKGMIREVFRENNSTKCLINIKMNEFLSSEIRVFVLHD